jgi:light-regulated signal transduction histidine kinase (bacteriophytochrome)
LLEFWLLADAHSYPGLHFPASDIPVQARALYKINKVRLLYDRDQETARLVCKTEEDLNKPVDLTHGIFFRYF